MLRHLPLHHQQEWFGGPPRWGPGRYVKTMEYTFRLLLRGPPREGDIGDWHLCACCGVYRYEWHRLLRHVLAKHRGYLWFRVLGFEHWVIRRRRAGRRMQGPPSWRRDLRRSLDAAQRRSASSSSGQRERGGRRVWTKTKPKCVRDDCERKAYCAGGLCPFHSPRCAFPTCENVVKSNEFCLRHLGDAWVCAEDGCGKLARAKNGFCPSHDEACMCTEPECRNRTKAKNSACHRHDPAYRCTHEDGCRSQAKSKGGVCKKHSTDYKCTYPGCKRVVRKKTGGYCEAHGGGYGVCVERGCGKEAKGSRRMCRRHSPRCARAGCNAAATMLVSRLCSRCRKQESS